MGDKRLIHAVAGSGKTTKIIESINPNNRNLIITYTENNQNNIREKLIAKFGHIPENTSVFGVFEFLYNFCLVPYLGKRPKGINFEYKPKGSFETNTVDASGRIIFNQLSKSLLRGTLKFKEGSLQFDNSYLERIDKFFDHIYVDECQDFESDDFDWLLSLSSLKAEVLLLGDFYQKTFHTSKRGNKGKGVHSSFDNWLKNISDSGFEIDLLSLSKSYRCPKSICDFIFKNMGIKIHAQQEASQFADIMFIESPEKIDLIVSDDSVMKLFYQQSQEYVCNSQNWGESKGSEFNDVCVVLNKTTFLHYKNNTLKEMPRSTKAKFYVACTRTRGNLYFINQEEVEKYKERSVKKYESNFE